MKKFSKILAATALLAPAFTLADATSTVTLPPGFIASIWQNVQSTINGTSDYTSAIVGVILAAIVIEILVGALTGRK